jgi:hypothetical protein
MTFFTHPTELRTMYAAEDHATAMVRINGPERACQKYPGSNCIFDKETNGHLQFCLAGRRKGAPAFRTTPAKIYSKQEIRKRVVFSELLMVDLS